jgi:hypothetical protein
MLPRWRAIEGAAIAGVMIDFARDELRRLKKRD